MRLTLLALPLAALIASAPVEARTQRQAQLRAAVYPQGMVSAADPRAAEAGAAMLRQGGNAVDAAMAVLLALNVVEPQSSGIGGGGYAVIDDGHGHLTTLDGRETAPAAADGQWFYVDGQPLSVAQAIPGGRSVGVPGNVALMAAAHARLGKLPWAASFAPAIRLARDGFAVSPRLHDFLGRFAETGAMSAAARALYYRPDGAPLATGTIIRNPALAASLERLAARSRLISIDHALPSVSAGTPPGAVAEADTLTPNIPSTSHFVVVDRRGEVVSETSTIESPFGSGLMVGGYYLNNELTDFSLVPTRDGMPVANRVEPGKRPRSAMAPCLVYAPDGRLRLAIGAAGGATIPAQVIHAIIGVIEWKLSAQDAIALPMIFAPAGGPVMLEQRTALAAMAPALRAMGHDVAIREGMYKANAVEVVQGRLVGAADPRSEGKAVGE